MITPEIYGILYQRFRIMEKTELNLNTKMYSYEEICQLLVKADLVKEYLSGEIGKMTIQELDDLVNGKPQ